MTTATVVARDIVNRVREKVAKRCETCIFWQESRSWWAPKYWKRCSISGKDTSPVFSCKQWKSEEEGNGS